MNNKNEIASVTMKNIKRKICIRMALLPLFFGFFILLPAGTVAYWQAYLWISIIVIVMTGILFYFLKNDPQFLERRMKLKEREKAQIVFQIVSSFLFISGLIISGFDRRFGWSNIPSLLVIGTDLIIVFGYLIIFFVFKQNTYASRIVEVDSNQQVISTGLYSIVRHPMYVGVCIMWIPIPIALGSVWGLIPMAITPLFLVLRIINEESVLTRELPGYKEYCQKTKYRLIPFIW